MTARLPDAASTAIAVGSNSSRGVITLPEPTKRGWEMKALKPRHKQIAALLVTGMRRNDVAEATGVTPELISMLMAQALFKSYLATLQEQMEQDLQLMTGKAVRVLDEALEHTQDMKVRLQASDQLWKVTGKYAPKEPMTATAEDIVQKLLQVNIQINNGPAVRTARVDLEKE